MSRRAFAVGPVVLIALTTATVPVQSASILRGPPPSHAGIVQRTQGRTVRIGGRVLPASDYFTKTPPETVVTLRSGAKTTLGKVVDAYARLDAALKTQGSSLDGIQKNRWQNGAPPQGMQDTIAVTNTTNALVHVDPSKPHGQVNYPQGDPNRAQSVDYNIDRAFFAVTPYNYFDVTAANPASQSGTSCSVSWNAGLKLYTKQFDIVKIVGSESTNGATFVDATIHVYVLGNSEFAGDIGADGDPPFEKALSTSQLPGGDPSMDMDVISGIMKVHAVAGGSAYFKMFSAGDSGAVVANGQDKGFYCSLDIKPTLRTEGHLRADAAIGPSVDGMPALTVVARGSIEPLRLDLPTHAMVALHDTPVKIGFGLTSTLTTQLMAGKIDFAWQLPDICEAGNCVMADGLGAATSGTIASWDHPATLINGPFVNVDPGLGGETLSSR